VILDQYTRSLEIVLGEAHTTRPCDVICCYATSSSTAFQPALVMGHTNGTTAVTLLAGTISGAQIIQEVRLWNNDTVTHNVTLRVNDGTTTIIIKAASVSAGDGFLYAPTVA
jgi:hypothetical protein